MTDDLIERLREWIETGLMPEWPIALLSEAADEVERLKNAYPLHTWMKEKVALRARIAELEEALVNAALAAEGDNEKWNRYDGNSPDYWAGRSAAADAVRAALGKKDATQES